MLSSKNNKYFMAYVFKSILLKNKSTIRKSPNSIASSALNITIAAPADMRNSFCFPDIQPSNASSTEIKQNNFTLADSAAYYMHVLFDKHKCLLNTLTHLEVVP